MTTRLRRVPPLVLLVVLAGCGTPTPPPNVPRAVAPTKQASSPRPGTTATAPPVVGDAALAAGRDFATLFFSPDYRTIEDYSDRVESGSTGTFRSEFAAKRQELHQLLTQVRSSARNQILAAAVRNVSPSSAVVLVATDQHVRSTSSGGKDIVQRYRVAEQLRLVDGRWLIENLEPILNGVYETGCSDGAADPGRNALLRQGCSAIEQLFSYDYRRIDADLADQRSLTIGALHTEIEQNTGPALRSLAPKEKARVATQVDTAAIERVDGDTATVLLFANEAVDTTSTPQPRLDRDRIEATLQRVDGRWLVSGVKLL